MEKQVWECVKVLEKGNVRVRITKSSHTPRPRYSWELSRVNEDDKSVRYFSQFVEARNGQCTLKDPVSQIAFDLIKEAEDWILVESQKREDEIWEDRRQREQTAADRDKPQTRHTGKTARERDKAKGNSESTESE